MPLRLDPVPLPQVVETLLCDADGNLFPSEEPAFEASVGVTNRLLERLGAPERYDAPTLRRVALGRNFRSLAVDLASGHETVLPADELDEWVAEEARVVTAHLAEVLRPDPRVTAVLESLVRAARPAVVSSSALARLDACFRATGLAGLFPEADRFSAQDSLPVPTSKPDPAVYLHAVATLEVDPSTALAVEDAVAGVASAAAAGLAVAGNLVFVPPAERDERRAELLAAGAVVVVDDWTGLADVLATRLATAGRSR